MHISGLHGANPIDLLKRAVRGFLADDMLTYAAALAYSALFALFPFLIFLTALLGFLDIPEFFDWLLDQARSALPADTFRLVDDVIRDVQSGSNGGLLSIGILVAIWSASAGVRSVMNAMNVAFGVDETRSAPRRYALSVLYTLGLAALLIASAGLMLLGPRVMRRVAGEVGLGDVFVTLWTWLRWPVLALLLLLAAALIYHVAPNVDRPFALITPGALLAVVIWVLASIGFSRYVSSFGNYSATYGSLGGMVVLLLYFYLSSAVLLLGAEVNAQLHRLELGEPLPAADSEN